MTSTFDLRTEPWIPVTRVDGTASKVGLRDLIVEAPTIRDVPVDPVPVYAPLVRIAVAIILRSHDAPLRQPDPVAWQTWGIEQLRSGPDAARLDNYLGKWDDRFYLLHPEMPFLQDPAIAKECDKPSTTNKLRIDVASGNNALWWTKTLDTDAPVLDHATAATALLMQWAYAAGGRCATRNGVATVSQAPLRSRTQYLPRGANLWETLLASSTVAADDHLLAANDCCWWERAPSDPVPAPGPLARLTGSPRGMLLVGDGDGVRDAYITWGAALPEDFWANDTLSTRRLDKDGTFKPYRLHPDQAVWADAPALLAARGGALQTGGIEPPAVLDPARNPLGGHDRFFDFGLTVLTHFPDKSKDIEWSRADLPGLIGRLEAHDPGGYLALTKFCEFATHAVNLTRRALKIPDPDDPRKQGAEVPGRSGWEQQVWREAEQLFWVAVTTRSWEDQARRLSRACLRLFEEATDTITQPRALIAVLKAERQLRIELDDLIERFGLASQGDV